MPNIYTRKNHVINSRQKKAYIQFLGKLLLLESMENMLTMFFSQMQLMGKNISNNSIHESMKKMLIK